jgi:hypothetical protein
VTIGEMVLGNMSLLMQNMELDIPSNEGKRIVNYIMGNNALSLMMTTK